VYVTSYHQILTSFATGSRRHCPSGIVRNLHCFPCLAFPRLAFSSGGVLTGTSFSCFLFPNHVMFMFRERFAIVYRPRGSSGRPYQRARVRTCGLVSAANRASERTNCSVRKIPHNTAGLCNLPLRRTTWDLLLGFRMRQAPCNRRRSHHEHKKQRLMRPADHGRTTI